MFYAEHISKVGYIETLCKAKQYYDNYVSIIYTLSNIENIFGCILDNISNT